MPWPGAAGLGAGQRNLDTACAEVGRDPREIRRSVQVFLHPQQPDQVDGQLNSLAAYRRRRLRARGAVVLSTAGRRAAGALRDVETRTPR